MNNLTTIIIFFASVSTLCAQPGSFKPTAASQYKETLMNRRFSMEAMKLSVSQPSNYTEVKQYVPPFDCISKVHKRNILGSNIAYVFIKKDSSVAIVLALLERDTDDYKRTERTMRFLHRGLRGSPDSVWLYNARGRADMVNHSLHFLSNEELKPSNAENGVEFFMDCSNLLLDKYQIARGIVFDKKYRGICEVYYFSRVGRKVNIDKEIKKTRKLISYAK